MMIIVPTFAEREDRNQPIVPGSIGGVVISVAPDMTNGVHHTGSMDIRQYRSHLRWLCAPPFETLPFVLRRAIEQTPRAGRNPTTNRPEYFVRHFSRVLRVYV
jgi:hypothetical protein